MLNKLSRFIERHLQPGGASLTLSTHQKQLAIAALLVEVAIADHHFSNNEFFELGLSLERKFSLTKDEINELISLAQSESEHSTSLHQFTQIVNQHCDNNEKFGLVKSMWEMAFADGNLDKHEDYLIRKIADLIYLPHFEFIRAKSQVKSTLINNSN